MIKNLKKLFLLLNNQEKKNACLLLVMVTIMAILDMIGVASILPFMSVLLNPNLIETNFILNNLYNFSKIFGVENNQHFFIFLGIAVFFMLITSNAFKALTNYVTIRFTENLSYRISKTLFKLFMQQRYSWYLYHHSADLTKIILSEVEAIVSNGMSPTIELIAKSFIAIAIVFLLVVLDPIIALTVGLVLASSYLIIFLIVKKYLSKYGEMRLFNNQLRFMTVNEAFRAIKEIKVGLLEQFFIKNFSESGKNYAKAKMASSIIGSLPKFFLEAISFGGILLILLFIMIETNTLTSALPTVSLYVFAGYRLMPALQVIYVSFTKISYLGPSLVSLDNEIKKLSVVDENEYQNINTNKDKIDYKNLIELKNIYYDYPNSSRTALENINLTIPIKSTVGLVGVTGSGKTTVVDVILRLLEPQKGTLEVDGNAINKKNELPWKHSIGYVPQDIYLSDDTIAANIGFGLTKEEISQVSIERAAKIANIHQFIIEELPDGYKTKVGENGVRLSGGQCQRIGIARALYHKPKILILDEATSALDNETERLVMNSIEKLNKSITIIMIAHRLETVKNCDIIYRFEKGKIIKKGKFNEII